MEADQADRLRNLGAIVTAGSLSGESSAKSAFNEFLLFLRQSEPGICPTESDINEISDWRVFNQDIVGRFPDFLLKKKGVAQKTTEAYLSHLKAYCKRKFPTANITAFEDAFYSKLRANAKKLYINQHMEAGTTMVKHVAKMTTHDLQIFCTILTTRNSEDDSALRCFLLLQWHAFGRVGEVSALKWSQFRFWSGDVVQTMQVSR
jgi:integrase